MTPLGIGDGRREQVGDGDGEVLLVERPDPRATHMFGAEHAQRATGLPQRDVEHGADPVRHQIAIGEAGRARIGPGIAGVDHALSFESGKVGRADLPRYTRADTVADRRRRALVQTHALDLIRVAVEPPDAQARDAECRRRRRAGSRSRDSRTTRRWKSTVR